MRDLHQSDGDGEIFSIWKDRLSLSEARCSSRRDRKWDSRSCLWPFLPRRNLIKINELGVGETTTQRKLRRGKAYE